MCYFLFSQLGCPDGWELVTAYEGRFLAALPAGGDVGASWGGPSLIPFQEEPTASHGIAGSLSLASTGVGLATGCCDGGYAKAGMYSFDGNTHDEAVHFPFIMLPMVGFRLFNSRPRTRLTCHLHPVRFLAPCSAKKHKLFGNEHWTLKRETTASIQSMDRFFFVLVIVVGAVVGK